MRFMTSLAQLFLKTRDPDAPAQDPRLAAVALLVEAARIDGRTRPEEQERLRDLAAARFGVEPDAVDAILRDASALEDGGDVADLARQVVHHFSAEERSDLVAELWDVAGADGDIHEFEEAIILRIGQMFDLSEETVLGLKAAVELARLGPDAP
jgi:uncharacterized tellurite resistance protein B-like protein